jgi:cyclopropane fatty-acyl-phospholipid synthase-like methyltransferase
MVLKNGSNVLEIACGDGFNARNFYSLRAKHIIACDFDPAALKTAPRKNQAPNIEYVLADIRTAMPAGRFDNIFWDAAIEHFTAAEIDGVLKSVKERLTADGILSGYTISEDKRKMSTLSHHEIEFRDTEDLRRFFLPHFKNVKVFKDFSPTRHNLYFWASNGQLPSI